MIVKHAPSARPLLVAALVLTFIIWPASTIAGGSCTVPGDYPNIQAAVDDNACVDIQLLDQTYTELLTIHRQLSITGGVGGMTEVVGQVSVTGEFVIAMLTDFRIESSCPDGALRVTGGAQATASGMQVVWSSGSSCSGLLDFEDGFEN